MLYTVVVTGNESFKILWGEREQPTRGPKPALSAERIARAAIAIADTEGLEAVSMHRVAAEFGYTTMSLYRYVPSKTALIDVMIDFAGADVPDLRGVESGWRAKIEHWIRQARELYRRHPWILAATPQRRRVMGPNELAWLDVALEALAEAGLDPAARHDAFIVLIGLARTAAQQELEAAGAADDEQWAQAMRDLMQRHGARYPALLDTMRGGGFEPSGKDTLEFGMRCVLDGLQLRLSPHPSP